MIFPHMNYRTTKRQNKENDGVQNMTENLPHFPVSSVELTISEIGHDLTNKSYTLSLEYYSQIMQSNLYFQR